MKRGLLIRFDTLSCIFLFYSLFGTKTDKNNKTPKAEFFDGRVKY